MCNSFCNYKYTILCIHFYWISDNNIKYINFEYIILVHPKILILQKNFGVDPSLPQFIYE